MWDDIRRIIGVALSHLREQKDMLVYKLIVMNYAGARDASLRRLGAHYLKAYKDGRITEPHDEGIALELDSLLRIEDEIHHTAAEIDLLRARSYQERDELLGRSSAGKDAAKGR